MEQRQTRILVVDDDPFALTHTAFILKYLGYRQIFQARSAAEARALAEKEAPHLALVDIMLEEEQDGIALAEELSLKYNVAPIFITARTEPRVLNKAAKIVPYGYLFKPLDPKQVATQLAIALQQLEKDSILKRFIKTLNNLLLISRELSGRENISDALQRVCELVTKRQSYHSILIIRSSERSDPKHDFYTSGFTPAERKSLAELLQAGKLPGCMDKACQEERVTITSENEELCNSCPLQETHGNNVALAAPLIFQKKLYGCILVTLKVRFRLTDIELSFFHELVFDIAHALGSSALKEKQRELEQNLQTILNSARDAIIITDQKGKITYANQSAKKLFGFEVEELLTKGAEDLFPDLKSSRITKRLKRHISQKTSTWDQVLQTEIRHKRGWKIPVEVGVSQVKLHGGWHFVGIIRDLRSRRRQERELRRLAAAVEQSAEAVLITDPEGRIQYANPAFEKITGYHLAEIKGQNPRFLKSGRQEKDFYRKLWETLLAGKVWQGHFVNRRKDGTLYEEESTITPVFNERGRIQNFVALKRDITNQVRMQRQLQQSQKLKAIGQLAAGIAHEINTPTQYIGDNLAFISNGFKDLLQLLQLYKEIEPALIELGLADKLEELKTVKEEIDLDYLLEELPQAVSQSREGVKRITEIVQALRAFSHPGEEHKKATDINRALQTTITVARNEWKYVADVHFLPNPNLPLVYCYPGEINQVFLNLIINAAQAIKQKIGNRPGDKGEITITTETHNHSVLITISDTGTGIPEEIRDQIFDMFFTTKEVGQGTGQGLALAHATIVDRHRGKIWFESEPGEGTTFFIELPISDTDQQS